MPVSKLTIQEFSKKVKDKYPEYKDMDDSTLASKVIEKYPEYKDVIQAAPIDPHQQQVAEAGAKIQNIVNSNVYTKAVSKMNAEQWTKSSQDLDKQFQSGDLSQDDYNKAKSDLIGKGFTAAEDNKNTAAGSLSDEGQMRKILVKAKDMNKDKNPGVVQDINSSAYLIDSKDRAEAGKKEQILKNAEGLKSGDLDYDLQTGQVIKPLGFFPAAANALGQRHKDMEDYDFYRDATPEQALERYKTHRPAAPDPDVPVEQGTGAGGWTGEQIGNLAIPTAKGIIGGAAGALAGPEGVPIGAGLANAHEFAKRAWAKSFNQKYGELLDKGEENHKAFDEATRHADVDGLIGGTMGGMIGSITPEAGGLTSEASPLISQLAKNKGLAEMGKELVVNGGQRAFMAAVKKTPGGLINAGIAAGGEVATNIHNDKPWNENALPAAGQMLALHYLLGALIPSENKNIKPEAVSKIADGVSRLNPEAVDAEVDKLVATKVIPENTATKLKSDIQDQRDLNTGIPDGTPPENKEKIQDLIQKRTDLQNQMDPDHPSYVDEAQHKNIKEKIDGVKKTNADGTTEGRDGINERIRQLMKPGEKEDGDESVFVKKPEPEEPSHDTPQYLVSRHADTDKDEQGQVSGPNQHPLSPDGRKDANDLATEVAEHAAETKTPVTKIVHSGLERAAETADKVAAKTGAQTIEDHGLDTWDIGQFDDTKDDEFKKIQKYFVEHPDSKIYGGSDDHFGKQLGETFNQYVARTIDAHAKYAHEPASTMLVDHSNNMMVMDAYRKNGGVWDEKAAHDYLNAEKPEPAKLVQKEVPKSVSVIKPKDNKPPVIAQSKSKPAVIMPGENKAPEVVDHDAAKQKAVHQATLDKIESDRKDELNKATKPDVKPEFVKSKDIDPEDKMDSDQFSKKLKKQDEIKGKYDDLKKLIDCLWK